MNDNNPFSTRRERRAEENNHREKEDVVSSLFTDSEEERLLAKRREKNGGFAKKEIPVSDNVETSEAIIERSRKEFSERYQEGGINAARYLTFDALQEIGKIDPDFFVKYLPHVIKAVNHILNELADNGDDTLATAQARPTDDASQNIAYRSVHAVAYAYLNSNRANGLNRSVMLVLIVNEILGFGPLDPLWRNRKITEIMVDSPWDIKVEISGKIHRVPAAYFHDRSHLYRLLERLYGSINKQVTQMSPRVDGRLHDKSRMSVVHHVAAPDGPNFSIRRHSESYWTPAKTIETGAASQEMMTDLGNMINKGASFLLIGGTGSGKTTTLNSLSGFFPDDERVLTIEDNIEMMLNPHKMIAAPMETVKPQPDRPDASGITMRELVQATLRLNPSRLIIGEVRDDAAYDLLQALNTGHSGAATTHANDADSGMKRIASLATQSGLLTIDGALPQIAAAFDFVIVLRHFPQDGSRKIASINEVAMTPTMGEDGLPYLPTIPLWEFETIRNSDSNDLTVRGNFVKKNDLSDIRKRMKGFDLEKDKTWEELKELSHVDEELLKAKRQRMKDLGRI